MKILYIHQYFKTPHESGSTRSFWISKKLIEKGHEVTVITGVTNKNQKLESFHIMVLRLYISIHSITKKCQFLEEDFLSLSLCSKPFAIF